MGNIQTLKALWFKTNKWKKNNNKKTPKRIDFRIFYFFRSFLLPHQEIIIIVLRSIQLSPPKLCTPVEEGAGFNLAKVREELLSFSM